MGYVSGSNSSKVCRAVLRVGSILKYRRVSEDYGLLARFYGIILVWRWCQEIVARVAVAVECRPDGKNHFSVPLLGFSVGVASASTARQAPLLHAKPFYRKAGGRWQA